MTTKKKRKFVEPDTESRYVVDLGRRTRVWVRVMREKDYQRLLKLARKGYGK